MEREFGESRGEKILTLKKRGAPARAEHAYRQRKSQKPHPLKNQAAKGAPPARKVGTYS